MHLGNLVGRWAHEHLDRRSPQTQKTTTAADPTTNIVSSIIDTVTSVAAPTNPVVVVTATPTPTDTGNNNPQTTDTPATSNTPQATQAKTTQQPASSAKPAASQQLSAGQQSTALTIVTASENVPTGGSAPSATLGSATTTAANHKGGTNGTSSGLPASQIGMAVGIVVGIAGGFFIVILGIYFWRRHRRRQQMERLGSMEELTRAPSPPLLSRSLTRGAQGPRQPIDDDDDDDFLTPMDTMPNTHRLDDYSHNGHEDQTAQYFTDDKSIYGDDSQFESDPNAPHLNPAFPVLPPAAVVPSNGRYYSGDFTQMRPGTSSGQSSGGQSPSGANPSIPSYSAMNKYAAYSPAASSNNHNGGAYSPPGPGTAVTSNSPVSSFSRPGAGYRGFDNGGGAGYNTGNYL